MTDYNSVTDVARALHELMSSDMHIQDALGNPARLYDDPPEDPVFPYLTYGPVRSEDKSVEGARLTAHEITLHLWSRYSGRGEALALIGTIATALTAAPLELTEVTLVNRHIIYTDIFRASDGLTLHGVVRLRVTTDRELETSL